MKSLLHIEKTTNKQSGTAYDIFNASRVNLLKNQSFQGYQKMCKYMKDVHTTLND